MAHDCIYIKGNGKNVHFAFNAEDTVVWDVPVKHIHLYIAHGIQEVQ